MKKAKPLFMTILILSFGFACGSNRALTSNFRIAPNGKAEIKLIRTIFIADFECENKIVANAVKNIIMQELINCPVTISPDSNNVDARIIGIITRSDDRISSEGVAISDNRIKAYGSGSEGAYVTGITTHIIKDGKILCSITETQVRTNNWIPDPPEVMGRKVAKRIHKLF